MRIAILSVLACLALAAGEAQRPNVIVILADDLGYSDIGCFGGEIATPHLDALAAGGMRLTQFTNTGRCCPTRASLLTGLWSHRAGIGHMVDDKGHPAYLGRLNERCATIAELLVPAGYDTVMVGKWHVGNAEAYWPRQRGFTRFYGQPIGGGSYFTRKTDRAFVLDDAVFAPAEPEPATWYKTDDYTDFALKLLNEQRPGGKPFYLHLCYTAPHWPLQAPEVDIRRYLDTYRDGWDAMRERRLAKQQQLGVSAPGTSLPPREPAVRPWSAVPDGERADWIRRMAIHAAMVDIMDRNIGRVVAWLTETGQLDRTLILFLSDNGASAETLDRGTPGAVVGTRESYTGFKQPWAMASNTPFRRWKSIVHEGGIATPLIAHWPQGIPPGRIVAQAAHVVDVVPTVLDLTGTAYPAQLDGRPLAPLDGISLRPVLTTDTTQMRPPLFWEHEGNRAIRRGDWKLVAERGQAWELYDLAKDRNETTDLATAHPDVVAELRTAWQRWADDVGVKDPAHLKRKP